MLTAEGFASNLYKSAANSHKSDNNSQCYQSGATLSDFRNHNTSEMIANMLFGANQHLGRLESKLAVSHPALNNNHLPILEDTSHVIRMSVLRNDNPATAIDSFPGTARCLPVLILVGFVLKLL